MSDIRIELADCENTILSEIGNKAFKRRDIALTYSLALRSSERVAINFARINSAIIERWSVSGLNWIKTQAWKMAAPDINDPRR